MDIKLGTKNFANAEQTGKQFRPEASSSMSADAQAKALGDQSIGDVLNKVADPNYVDKSKVRRVGNAELDKDAFMKLMLTQMKYQDPTNPMQNHEMAAQLAQFSALEQMNNINTTLEAMKNGQQPQTNFTALNFIGKMVSGDSSKLTRTAGDKYHDFNFELMSDASEVSVLVKNPEGEVVRTLKGTNLKKGPNTISWNGLNEDGAAQRPGEYKFVIEAKSTAGTKVPAKTQFDGKITGLNFTPAGPILMVGKQTVRMSDVKKIYEAPQGEQEQLMAGMMAQPAAQKLEAGGAQGLQMMKQLQPRGEGASRQGSAKEDVPGAADDSAPVSNLQNGVGMSQGMINKLQKESGKA